jgi:hypothetical protein
MKQQTFSQKMSKKATPSFAKISAFQKDRRTKIKQLTRELFNAYKKRSSSI